MNALTRHILDNDPDLIEQTKILPPKAFSFSELISEYPEERPYVIDGLVRLGETFNVIAASKTGKSWLVLGMAMSIAMGRPWLGRQTQKGNVLLIDNELQPTTLAQRIDLVRQSLGISERDLSAAMTIVPLRGNPHNLNELESVFEQYGPGDFQLVVIDALYRVIPANYNENDNNQMKEVYNMLDKYAARLQAAQAVVHHSPKGDTSQRSTTDLGAGAGAIARCPDAQITVRPHADENLSVLEAICRTSKKPEPATLRFEWPLWHLVSDVAPVIYNPRTRDKEKDKEQKATEKAREDEKNLNALLAECGNEPVVKTKLRTRLGWNPDKFNRVLALGEKEGALEVKNRRKKNGTKNDVKNGPPKRPKKGRPVEVIKRLFLTLELARIGKNPIEIKQSPENESTQLEYAF
jgi:RecA-family ATPase